MTLAVAWTRSVANTIELLVASDSRLSGGGGHVDTCQKVFSLPRGDVAIAFCGTTSRAYPVVHQIMNFVANSPKAMSRGMDPIDLRNAILAVINEFRASYQNTDAVDVGDDDHSTLFLFSGYSWKLGRFVIFTLHYDASARRYVFRPAGLWGGQRVSSPMQGKRIAVVGDHVAQYKDRLRSLLAARGRLGEGGFNMEPFEVLVSMLNDETFSARTTGGTGLIGGVPQLTKVYRYGAALPFAIKHAGNLHMLGRRLLDFERTLNPILDTSTLSVSYPMDSVAN